MKWKEINLESWLHFCLILEQTGGIYTHRPMWSFRGHADNNWTLRPALTRKLLQHTWINSEIAKTIEQQLFAEFSTGFHAYSESARLVYAHYDRMRWMSIMQHFGCPTRLLDWSDSAYVAAYFACEALPEADGAIYCLADNVFLSEMRKRKKHYKNDDEEDLLWSTGKDPEVWHMTTNFQNQRCLSQHGTFTFCTSPFEDHDEFISYVLRDVPESHKYHLKLVVPNSLKLDFLSHLNTMGINAATLFPGPEGFGRSFNAITDMIVATRKITEDLDLGTDVDDSMFSGGKHTRGARQAENGENEDPST
ncbi:MAG: FRG domain-containing protein [Gammaproteobacteria bacterium]